MINNWVECKQKKEKRENPHPPPPHSRAQDLSGRFFYFDFIFAELQPRWVLLPHPNRASNLDVVALFFSDTVVLVAIQRT